VLLQWVLVSRPGLGSFRSKSTVEGSVELGLDWKTIMFDNSHGKFSSGPRLVNCLEGRAEARVAKAMRVTIWLRMVYALDRGQI